MNTILHQLGAQALFGTARRAPELPVGDTPAGLLLRDLTSAAGASGGAGADPDEAARLLLRGAGVLAVCALAGHTPAASEAGDIPPSPCPAETRPVLPEGSPAIDLCREIFSGGSVRLQWEALQYLDERGMTLAPSLLVPALGMGRRNSALRPLLARLVGERGLWLAALNPEWKFFAASSAGEPDPEA